ncbi:MAG: NAD(P)-dependent oxidoreductase [Thiotrichaceae bacterium]
MKIALLGTGLLGAEIAKRLLQQKIDITVWNRTPEKTLALAAQGMKIANTPQQAIATTDATILMLADAPAVREVLFSEATCNALTGKTMIQMGTIAPRESQLLATEILALDGDYLEAPVLGSLGEAQQGNLIVMVGGNAAQFAQWQPLFQHLGQDVRLIGDIGQAAALKLALNQLIGSLTVAFSLSLGMVEGHDIDVNVFMELLRSSSLYAKTFDKKLDRMLQRDFTAPNFPTQHLLKDMRLVLAESRRLGLGTEALQGVVHLAEQAVKEGEALSDYSAIFNAVVPVSSA